MKRKFAVILLLVVFETLPGVAVSANARLTGKNELLDFVRAYDKAWNNRDVISVDRVLAAEYVYFSSRGGVSSRANTLDMLRSPKYILKSAERSEVEIYRTGNTAIVSSRWKGHGSYDGEEFRDDQRCSIVLARSKQTWKVLAEHCTQIVAK